MADRFIISHIQRLPMFQMLSDADLNRLADLFQVLRLERGEMVFRQWEPSQGLFMFVSGQGVLMQQRPDGTQQQLGVVGPNQFLNEAALSREGVESATLYITETAIVLFLHRQAYQMFLSQPAPAQPTLSQTASLPTTPMMNPGMNVAPRITPSLPNDNQRLPIGAAQTGRTFENVSRGAASLDVTQQTMQPTLGATLKTSAAYDGQDGPESAESIGKIGHGGVSPDARTFAGQRQNETVILMTRRHWIAWVRRSALAILIAGLLFFAATIVPSGPFAFLIIIFTFLLPVAMIVYSYINWRDDWLIVTSERIVHVEQMWVALSTRVSEVQLKNVQSINADYPHNDPLAYYFKYGNLDIKTAGNAGNVQMDFIPDPDAIKDLIFAHREQLTSQESQAQQREQLKAVLDAKFGGDQHVAASQTVARDPARPSNLPERGLLSTHFINEKGEMVYRKHLLFWARKVTLPLVLIFGALMLVMLGMTALNDTGLLIPLIAFVLLVIGVVSLYYADWDWRNDLYIIGDNTITLIHKRPFFAQDEDEQLTLDRIDNIQTERSGLLRRIFNYGNVNLQLLGDSQPHVFKNVPNPQTIREEISRRQSQRDQRAKAADLRRQREDVVEAIRLYHEEYGGVPGGGVPGGGAEGNFNTPPAPPASANAQPGKPAASRPRFRGRE